MAHYVYTEVVGTDANGIAVITVPNPFSQCLGTAATAPNQTLVSCTVWQTGSREVTTQVWKSGPNGTVVPHQNGEATVTILTA